jgi:hypothetical protein
MTAPKHSSRRIFLLSTTAAIATATTTACQEATMSDRQLAFKTLDEALRELDRLASAPALKIATGWTLAQTLDHCAQSIEYSLTGFPESKSALFQNTAGALALKVFSWRGRMSHSLTEPIPGAPALDGNIGPATARLRQAVQNFHSHTTALRPHFAYGELSKAAYEQAHAMHLANHFSAFDVLA